MKTAPVDLKKLCDIGDNEVVKNKNFSLDVLIKKIPDTSGLVTTTVLNTKISEVENKIPDTSSLLTTAALNAKNGEVENKISNHAIYTTTPEFNKVATRNFAAKLKQANLVTKTDFDNKPTSFNKRITTNKTKHLEVPKS